MNFICLGLCLFVYSVVLSARVPEPSISSLEIIGRNESTLMLRFSGKGFSVSTRIRTTQSVWHCEGKDAVLLDSVFILNSTLGYASVKFDDSVPLVYFCLSASNRTESWQHQGGGIVLPRENR